MPTYDFECGKCGHVFEVFQKMSDKPSTKCPKCRAKADRLIGAGSGVIFKGSGFYQTDYKAKKEKKTKEPTSCPKADSGECKGCGKG